MYKQPEPLTYTMMNDVVSHNMQHYSDHVFLNEEIGFIHGSPNVFKSLMLRGVPFAINDFRIGMVLNGSIRSVINLKEAVLSHGSIGFLRPGAIVQPINISPDFQIIGFALFPDFTLPFAEGKLPGILNSSSTALTTVAAEEDLLICRQLLETVWQVVSNQYDRPTVSALVMAVMNYLNKIFSQSEKQFVSNENNDLRIFNRFIELVNTYATREHRIAFYADQLCLTERYLGHVVKQSSNSTAKEWIDRAVIIHAKVLLRHTRKSVLDISEALNFPNPAFFSKFFKRATGTTPLRYRYSND